MTLEFGKMNHAGKYLKSPYLSNTLHSQWSKGCGCNPQKCHNNLPFHSCRGTVRIQTKSTLCWAPCILWSVWHLEEQTAVGYGEMVHMELTGWIIVYSQKVFLQAEIFKTLFEISLVVKPSTPAASPLQLLPTMNWWPLYSQIGQQNLI